jgi:hypothetical protein
MPCRHAARLLSLIASAAALLPPYAIRRYVSFAATPALRRHCRCAADIIIIDAAAFSLLILIRQLPDAYALLLRHCRDAYAMLPLLLPLSLMLIIDAAATPRHAMLPLIKTLLRAFVARCCSALLRQMSAPCWLAQRAAYADTLFVTLIMPCHAMPALPLRFADATLRRCRFTPCR